MSPRTRPTAAERGEERALLAATVERLFAGSVDREQMVAAERGGWLEGLWDAAEAAGLLRPHLSERAGGAGASWREAFVVTFAAGRHCVPLPIAETLVAGWLLARAGLDVPEGPLTFAPAPLPEGALSRGGGPVALARVPWARHAGHVVLRAREGGGAVVACAPLAGAEVQPGENLAREPRDDVRLTIDAAPTARIELPAAAVTTLGAMVRTAQMAGALEAILDLAVAYANERVQFGRPIGRFQVIQQELARLAGQVAVAGTAAELAFRAAAEADTFAGEMGALGDPTFEVACAKVVVGEAAEAGPRIAHQVHGAIGFTYEHSLHFATRRLWAWRSEFGSGDEWAARLGTAALAAGADALWSSVTAR